MTINEGDFPWLVHFSAYIPTNWFWGIGYNYKVEQGLALSLSSHTFTVVHASGRRTAAEVPLSTVTGSSRPLTASTRPTLKSEYCLNVNDVVV